MNPVTGLSLGRIVVGAISFAKPSVAAGMFGLDIENNPQGPYLARLFGSREIALGAATLLARGTTRRNLVVAGIGGLLLPGPVGTPFLILGGVMLWPRAFGRLEDLVEKRFPRVHHQGVRQIKRFLDDLDRRYPIPKS